jgi:uncharacterized paraquat-inducible protein A
MNKVECSYCKKYFSYANINRHENKYCKRNQNSLSSKKFHAISQPNITDIIDNSKKDKQYDCDDVNSSKVPSFSDLIEFCKKQDEELKFKNCIFCKLKVTTSNIRRHENNHCKKNPESKASKKFPL